MNPKWKSRSQNISIFRYTLETVKSPQKIETIEWYNKVAG